MRKRMFRGFFCVCVMWVAGLSAYAQTIVLNPITVVVENSEKAHTRGAGQSRITDIVVADPAIASAREGGTNDVLITGKRPGRTVVTFYDQTHGRSYRVSVTVEARAAGQNQNQPPGNQGGNQGGGSNSPPGYIRPIEVQSKAPEEPPTLLNTGNGYNAVYKNQYGEIVQVKEYDKNGRLIRTKEIDMYYPDGKPASVSYEKPNGDLEEITYDASSNVVTKQIYTELNKDNGYMKKEVLENGVMKKYEKDANGKWQPVAVNQQPPKAVANQPQKNDAPPQIGFQCLAGTWRSVSVSKGFYTSGGDGIVLTIKAAGQASVDYDSMNELKADSPMGVLGTQIFSGKGAATIKLEGQKLSATGIGTPSIRIKSTGQGAMNAGPFSGLGPLVGVGGTLKYVCSGDTLTVEPFEVDKFNFVRVK